MDDDLNVSMALASLFDFVRDINNLLDANAVSKQEATTSLRVPSQAFRQGSRGRRRNQKRSDIAQRSAGTHRET